MNRQIRIWTDGLADSHVTGLAELKQKLEGKFNHEVDSNLHEYSATLLCDVIFGITPRPAFVEVCGEDGFYAKIPWHLADSSFFRFPDLSDGDGDGSDGGLRLFVRYGSNACLNVKAIVDVQFGYGNEPELPVFGSKLPDKRRP